MTIAVPHAIAFSKNFDAAQVRRSWYMGFFQLPLVVRGVYYDGWNPRHTPVRVRNEEDFLDLVEQRAPRGLTHDSARVARALFRTLTRHLSPGEADAVRHVLPTKIAAPLAVSIVKPAAPNSAVDENARFDSRQSA